MTDGIYDSDLAMRICRAVSATLLAATTVAGCSGGFGGPKRDNPAPAVDANAFPTNYRSQIVTMLTSQLTDRADYHGALIAPPVLKPVGENQHYVVCLQFNGHNEHKNKVVYYLGGIPTQFIDATPQLCGDAAYQPFPELEAMTPSK